MKNKNYYNNLENDDKGMHLFYMAEELQDLAEYIGNEMNVNTPAFASRMCVIEEMIDRLSGMSDRIKKENEVEKTKNSINYAI